MGSAAGGGKPGDKEGLTAVLTEHALAASTAIFTLGHSTRRLDDFVEILRHYGIECLADVRTVPRSRHNPLFNKDSLEAQLREQRIDYRHMQGLGGLRHDRNDSPNTGWRNASFRGFADYMQTPEFAAALNELIELAKEKTVAIMCAEAVPWRCHRSLIGDALLVRGIEVRDIYSMTNTKAHGLTAMARVEGLCITYPAPDEGACSA
jgi:uncharacterized protein (DUF488 family)